MNNRVKINSFSIRPNGALTFNVSYVSDSTKKGLLSFAGIQPGLDGPNTEIVYFGIPNKLDSNYIDKNCNWYPSDFVKNFNDKKYVAEKLERYSTRFCFINDDDVYNVILILKDNSTGAIDTLYNKTQAKKANMP
jgi:hypothetical protein